MIARFRGGVEVLWFIVGESGKVYTECETYQGCFRWMIEHYPSAFGDFDEKDIGLVQQLLPEVMCMVPEKKMKK